MEYFKLLHLIKEPFSNSPDPAFFYESDQHKECIQKLEIALRLRRGLNVVTGEVGTGKTTLCRQLIQAFSGDSRISASLILDPDFSDPRSFLSTVVHMMTGRKPELNDTIPDMKERLKHYLFQKGVEEEQTIVLIVDEGQKMPPACMETLRELLNFETNEYKLLQIIIFAQNEFADTLGGLPNLADRINLYYRLGPLNFRDSRALIHHRLQHAVGPETPSRPLFSLPAQWRIFRLSGGYPRKIIHLCHQCLLAMIIQNKAVVGWRIAGACARRTFRKPSFFRPAPVTIALLLMVCMGFGAWHYSDKLGERVWLARRETAGADASSHPLRNAETENTIDGLATWPAHAETTPIVFTDTVIAAGHTAAASASPAERKPTTAAPEAEPPGGLLRKDMPGKETPTTLGQVTVAIGDTLGGLVQKVYGTYTYRYHQAVLDANPELVNPDRLDVGQQLIFPALSADAADIPSMLWWITLSDEADLEAAVSVLRRETDSAVPLRLLASWTREEGLVFRIALKTWYENLAPAELEKNRMASQVPVPMEIICLETNGICFFGNLSKF